MGPDSGTPRVSAMVSQQHPAQRLLVQGVVASTMQLVRCIRDGEFPAVRPLMLERRRMLAELAQDETAQTLPGATWALHEAVAESDRTLEALLA
jgi:hypothetical protein